MEDYYKKYLKYKTKYIQLKNNNTLVGGTKKNKKTKKMKNKLLRQDIILTTKMNTFEGKLQSPYYEYIRDGIKIYEMRVNDEKRQKMNIGDIWKFKHASDETLPQYDTQIIDKKIYKSFEEAIEETGYEKLLPNAKSKEEAIKIYNAFDNGNYETDAIKYGVVRFTIKMLN
jgi:ASC-1-like (ASCH) protein